MTAIADYIRKIRECVSTEKDGSCRLDTWNGSVSKKTGIEETPFVVFDMEMSGLDPKKDFIVSIGALKMTGGAIHPGSEFYRLVKPSGRLTKKNVEIHGITPDELEGQRSMGQILPEFLDFITDAVLVGHFVHIDMKFLNAAISRIYYNGLKNPAVDTLDLHEWLLANGAEFRKHYRGGSGKTDLFSIALRYGIEVVTVHNALSDAFITAQLFQKFLHFLQADGVQTLNELFDIGRV